MIKPEKKKTERLRSSARNLARFLIFSVTQLTGKRPRNLSIEVVKAFNLDSVEATQVRGQQRNFNMATSKVTLDALEFICTMLKTNEELLQEKHLQEQSLLRRFRPQHAKGTICSHTEQTLALVRATQTKLILATNVMAIEQVFEDYLEDKAKLDKSLNKNIFPF